MTCVHMAGARLAGNSILGAVLVNQLSSSCTDFLCDGLTIAVFCVCLSNAVSESRQARQRCIVALPDQGQYIHRQQNVRRLRQL